MRTIGLIGGLSCESSVEYYRIINRLTQQRLGGLHSASILMHSFDFDEIETLQNRGEWQQATQLMTDAALRLDRGGADFILICSNTMHRMADAVGAAVAIPLLRIVDPTGLHIQAAGFKRVGLLGTAYTMEQDFYKARLTRHFGIEILISNQTDRRVVHDIIYGELVRGVVREESRLRYRAIVSRLIEAGAQAIILGCTVNHAALEAGR
jgi:aspartate racemase